MDGYLFKDLVWNSFKSMRVGRRGLWILLPLRYCLLTFCKVCIFSVPNPSKSFWDANIPEAPSACSFAKPNSRKRQAVTLSSLEACLSNMGQIPRLCESRSWVYVFTSTLNNDMTSHRGRVTGRCYHSNSSIHPKLFKSNGFRSWPKRSGAQSWPKSMSLLQHPRVFSGQSE